MSLRGGYHTCPTPGERVALALACGLAGYLAGVVSAVMLDRYR